MERGSLRGIYVGPGAVVPTQDRLETMVSQAEIALGILRTNEDYYGPLHYLMSHSDKADIFYFPIFLNGRRMSLTIQVMPPYTHEDLVDRLRKYIGEAKAGTR